MFPLNISYSLITGMFCKSEGQTLFDLAVVPAKRATTPLDKHRRHCIQDSQYYSYPLKVNLDSYIVVP